MSDLVIVKIPCPICGNEYDAYATPEHYYPEKEFHFEDAPIELMAAIHTGKPILCQRCKSIFEVETNFSASIVLIEKGRFANVHFD